jgi:uncharacterized protein
MSALTGSRPPIMRLRLAILLLLFGCRSDKDVALESALRNRNVLEVKRLLEEGANPNATIESPIRPVTPLWIAVATDDSEALELLFKFHAEPKEVQGQTLVGLAAMFNASHVLPVLIRQGVPVKIQGPYLNTPLDLAASNGNYKIASQLLSAGADPNIRNSESNSNSLFHAVYGSNDSVSLLLLSHGADFQTPDNEGNTVLHIASKKCDSVLVRSLISMGANPTVRNKEGQTPLDVAGCETAKKLLK